MGQYKWLQNTVDNVARKIADATAPKNLVCPNCKSAIPLEDVNVAADIALCRQCNKVTPFTALAGMSEFADVDIDKPPKHVKLERDIMGDLKIIYRKRSPILFFLIPFTLFWSGLSMGGIYGSQIAKGEFELLPSLFGLPFLIGTIVLVSVITFLLFGRWQITLGDGEGKVFVGVGSLGWTRQFHYDQETMVALKQTNVEVNNVPQKGILIRTAGKDFVFGTGINDECKKYVAAIIQAVVNRRYSFSKSGDL